MTEPDEQPVDDAPEADEPPPGFHEPESEWSTEQRPGMTESTLPQQP